jgi:hypothetical protein
MLVFLLFHYSLIRLAQDSVLWHGLVSNSKFTGGSFLEELRQFSYSRTLCQNEFAVLS